MVTHLEAKGRVNGQVKNTENPTFLSFIEGIQGEEV